uniref:Uncharacterized protein n=1 Tax=Oryza nivara TaxID=4536 RepID=A0A0E0G724_ORYNI
MVPPPRPLAARRWRCRLLSLALSPRDSGSAISFPGRALSPQALSPFPSPDRSCRDWFVTSATWRPDDLLPRILLLPSLNITVQHLCPSPIAYYDGPLDAMAACVVHAGGSDGGIQAHIKACATLGAICSSVVTAHNTIIVQGVSVTLKPWLPERIKATVTVGVPNME